MKKDLGENRTRFAIIGKAGENQVVFSCVMHDDNHAAGRAGLGAVMGSKNLKAVAVRGTKGKDVADQAKLQEITRWLLGEGKARYQGMQDYGTDGGLLTLSETGMLPTRNFKYGHFEHAEKITGRTMTETILVDRPTCYACVVRCKRAVEVKEGPFKTDPRYGGPEYETCGALGSNCGIGDLAAVARGNMICNAESLDTINGGMAVSFAMECFENGIITEKDTGGLKLNFGNAEAMVKLLEMICNREGIGDLLAQGYDACIEKWGPKAAQFAIHVKKQPLPMHEPRGKFALGLGYAISPTGADHVHNIHDTGFETEVGLEGVHPFGIIDPLPARDLSDKKVRMMYYNTHMSLLKNMLGMCLFPPFNPNMTVDIIRAVTGWDTSLFELFKASERGMAMARAFNAREGFTTKDDTLPDRFFEQFDSGPLQGVSQDRQQFNHALQTLYQMLGWDNVIGVPTRAKFAELGLDWVADELGKYELVKG
jgi:aldehyde:ferredoxin oxidoreductase